MNESKVPLQLVISAQIMSSLINRHGAKGRSLEHFAMISLDASTVLIEKYNQLAAKYQEEAQNGTSESTATQPA